MNIGKGIKIVRTGVGRTQAWLSEKSGISQTAISQIEAGKMFPSQKTIRKLAKAMEFHEDKFYINGLSDRFQIYIKS